jgi:hypothetical protein
MMRTTAMILLCAGLAAAQTTGPTGTPAAGAQTAGTPTAPATKETLGADEHRDFKPLNNDKFTFFGKEYDKLTMQGDADGDGIPDAVEGEGDWDGDGNPNFLDTDSDNDGLSDKEEGQIDTDHDGLMNFLDSDSDGDHILDKVEGDLDTDHDGTPNYEDTDSDGDGIKVLQPEHSQPRHVYPALAPTTHLFVSR